MAHLVLKEILKNGFQREFFNKKGGNFGHGVYIIAFILLLQVGTPHTWMGVVRIACSAMELNAHISTFYPYVNGTKCTHKYILPLCQWFGKHNR